MSRVDNPYQPIPCGFHDLLLRHATLGDQVIIGILVEDTLTSFVCRILDVFTRSGAEFILLDDQSEHRLDQLRSVNGVEMHEDHCPN